jgi:hypothetical protein
MKEMRYGMIEQRKGNGQKENIRNGSKKKI